jgi:hypothetical protein
MDFFPFRVFICFYTQILHLVLVYNNTIGFCNGDKMFCVTGIEIKMLV